MKTRGLTLLAITLMLIGPSVVAETITAAHYDMPVDRYGHFALGWPHEYARLTAITKTGRQLSAQLPEDEVFEDIAPRIVKLSANEPEALLTIVSRRDSGARLVLYQQHKNVLSISAQSAAIGTPMRWLNPVGVVDLDGDGHAEVIAVITPHIGGTLTVYRKKGASLVAISTLSGFSNHVYGSPEIALSTQVPIDGRVHLLVPDMSRRHLRIIALKNDCLVETGRCALPEPITHAIKLVSPNKISFNAGRQSIDLKDCIKPSMP